MKMEDIRDLIRLLDDSSIDEFAYEEDGVKVTLKKNAPQPVQQLPLSPQSGPVMSPEPRRSQQTSETQLEQTDAGRKEENAQAETDEELEKIVSPMVGTFYSSPSPDADPYVKKGDQVEKGSVVCIVEAMKLFNEIEAEVTGEVVDILVDNGELVEYGQPLMLIRPK